MEAQKIKKSKGINNEQAECLEDLFSKLKWRFGWKSSDAKQLEKGKMPDSMVKLLTQAVDAETKLAGDAMRLMKALDDDASNGHYKSLKSSYKDSQAMICSLKHVQDFQELEDNSKLTKASFDGLMQKAAGLSTVRKPQLSLVLLVKFIVFSVCCCQWL